jgi:hypothetical protein
MSAIIYHVVYQEESPNPCNVCDFNIDVRSPRIVHLHLCDALMHHAACPRNVRSSLLLTSSSNSSSSYRSSLSRGKARTLNEIGWSPDDRFVVLGLVGSRFLSLFPNKEPTNTRGGN